MTQAEGGEQGDPLMPAFFSLGQHQALQAARLFFPHAFLTAECSVARTVLLVSLQALGTMLAIYIPAAPGCAEERAKSKPVSLRGGWKSGWLDLTDGKGVAFEVVAAR